MKILIGEDEPLIAKDYKLFLESRGHKVIIAKDGEECISKFNRIAGVDESTPDMKFVGYSPIDLVLLDFSMPKKDGLEVASEILSLFPSQRILFVTAFGEEATQESMKELDICIEAIQKPVDLEALAAMIEEPVQEPKQG